MLLLKDDTFSINLVKINNIKLSFGIITTINENGKIILVTNGIKNTLFIKPIIFIS